MDVFLAVAGQESRFPSLGGRRRRGSLSQSFCPLWAFSGLAAAPPLTPRPPAGRAMCSARSTDSHVSRIREPSQKHPGQCVAQHLGISWPSQDHSTITHYRGPGGSAAPGAQPGERRRRARGSSDSAAPKHRRRRRESGKPSLGGRSARAQRGGVREAIRLSRLLCCSQRQVRCRSAPE